MWHKIIKTIHQVTQNSTKLKIPVMYGIDSIHGAGYIDEAVLMPQQINQAATFNIHIPRIIGKSLFFIPNK
jgi:beta-glucosidase